MDGLHWADYLVFVCFLLVSVGIGAYHALTGGRQRTTAEFIMANRQLKVVPTMLSLSMSVLSAILVIGVSSEVYSYGVMFLLWSCIGTAVGILIVQQLFIVWLFPIQLTSAFEFLDRRFQSKAARSTASFLGVFGAILHMGVAMFAPSIALEAVTGVPTNVSIPVMTVIATLYTALGGMKAVIWTDVFQGNVMFIGLLYSVFQQQKQSATQDCRCRVLCHSFVYCKPSRESPASTCTATSWMSDVIYLMEATSKVTARSCRTS